MSQRLLPMCIVKTEISTDMQMFGSGSIAFAVYSMDTLGFKESFFVRVQTAKTKPRLCFVLAGGDTARFANFEKRFHIQLK